jgi:arylsulfatase A-like enzyme
MRRFFLTAILLLAGLATVRADSRPNVLFIAVDDLNHWIGALGRNPQTRTPNIDRLAARGVLFSHAYCAAPTCCPCRTALMSGYRPSTSGIYNNEDDWRAVIPADVTLTFALARYGYATIGAGKIMHDGFRRDGDWSSYMPKEKDDAEPKKRNRTEVGGLKFGPIEGGDDDLTDYDAVSFIIDQLHAPPADRPFFMACGLHKPHPPWYVPRKYFDLFPIDKIELPKTLDSDLDDVPPAGVKLADAGGPHAEVVQAGLWKQAIQGYLAAIACADAQVGRLLDALDASPYAKNTIIILWGDHGWHLGEKQHWGKHALWEEATRTPLIWVVPGLTQPGGVCTRPVDMTCIYPTLTDLLHIPTPTHCEGANIRTLLADPAAPWDKPAIMTWNFDNHAIRSEAYRYIRYHDGTEELYDEKADPLEWKNLASLPESAPIKAELAKFLPKINTPENAGPPGLNATAGKKKKKK